MLFILSFAGFVICFLGGFFSPRKMGWGALFLVVLFGQSPLAIIPSGFMPLTSERIAIAVTLGMVFKKYGDVPIRYLYKSTFVKILIVYTLLLLLSSARDEYLRHMIVSHIPNLFYSIMLCFLLIKNDKDFELFVKILVLTGGIIGFFIVIEYITDFSIAVQLAKFDPYSQGRGISAKATNPIYRSGYYRASGITGSAVQTGYILAFLFPLSLWYSIRKKLKVLNFIPLVMILIGLFLLMSRATFVAIFIGLVVLIIESKYLKGTNILKNFGKPILATLVILIFVFIAFPTLSDLVGSFFYDSLYSYDDPDSAVYIYSKVNRIPRAFDYFQAQPLTGYGSPQHAYFEVMNTDDLPAPLIILLAGGIPLAIAYLFMLFSMPYTVFKFSLSSNFNLYSKKFLIYASVALLIGVTVIFSNYVENHFWTMFMFYISIFKIYYLKPKFLNK